jgi:hypothetical protein
MTLRDLVSSFTPEGLRLRTLYRSRASPGPGAKGCRREVKQIARAALRETLKALEGGADVTATSGFETRRIP